MAKIRVLVVEDSLTVRKRLCEVLAADPEIEVVGDAGDGKRAIELCRSLRPDVVTLDMMLPVMSGLAATEYIMAHCPTPILIVSSSTNRGEGFKTYEALAAGAVDVLEKPRGDESDGEWERRFIATVKLVSRIKVITHLRAKLGALGRTPARPVSVQHRDTELAPSRSARTRKVVRHRRVDRRSGRDRRDPARAPRRSSRSRSSSCSTSASRSAWRSPSGSTVRPPTASGTRATASPSRRRRGAS